MIQLHAQVPTKEAPFYGQLASAPPSEGDDTRVLTRSSPANHRYYSPTEQLRPFSHAVMLCVRKAGDNVSTISQVGSKESIVTTTRKKHKTLKNIVVGRKNSQAAKEKEAVKESKEEERPGLPKIEDDDDGHLIYKKGDRLHNCKDFMKIGHTILLIIIIILV